MSRYATDSDGHRPGALGLVPMARWWIHWNGKSLPILWGSQEDDDESADDGNDENEDDEANEPDDEAPEAKRVNALTEEAKRHRLRAKKYRQSAEHGEAIVAALAKHFGKEPSDITTEALESLLRSDPDMDEKAREMTRDNAKLVTEVERLNGELTRRDVDDAIRDAALEAGFQPHRVRSVLRLIDRDDFEVDDGHVEGLADSIEKMAKDYPEWLSADGKSSDNGEKPPAAKGTGKRQRKPDLDVEYLRNKYPSLRR